MKQRNGFVSNSSSSSFMLAVKGEVATQEKLLELFSVPKDSFLYSFAVEVAGFFADHGQMEKYETVEDLRKDMDYLDDDKFKEEWARDIGLLESGWTLYRGYASDEGYDDVERWICNATINFKSDTLILESEGGY